MEIEKYEWVDALRGYAILLVVMIHTSIFFWDRSFHLLPISRLGDLGVTLFFITSCFTLFNSYQKRSAIDGDKTNKYFFIRRFFRIAPLYYSALIIYIFVGLTIHSRWVSLPLDPVKILANFTFLNGIYLPAINYLPPGSWSVGDEMLFYLLLPFLFSIARSAKVALWILVSAILFSFIIQIALYIGITHFTDHSWVGLRSGKLYFWFPNQFPVFCFGIVLYFVIKNNIIAYKEWMLPASVISIVLLSCFNYQLTFPWFLFQREYLYSVAFCFFAFSLSKTRHRFFIKPVNKIGKVSFSMYLAHFLVIELVSRIFRSQVLGLDSNAGFILTYCCVVFFTYLLSKITYRYVERPWVLKGESLIERSKSHNLNEDKYSRKAA